MKKRKPAKSSRRSRTSPEFSMPAHHPATGQLLSDVKGNNPYLPKQPRQKAEIKKESQLSPSPSSSHSTRDVFINRPT